MSESPDRDERHLARMLRKKAVIDERIANSPNECGLLLVLTGNGKGKSSSAFGMLARALGHGMQCGVVQFIKGRNSTGEELFFRRFPEQVRYHVMGEGFTWETQDRQRDIDKAEQAWAVARARRSSWHRVSAKLGRLSPGACSYSARSCWSSQAGSRYSVE